MAEAPDGRVLGAGGWSRDRKRGDLGHLRHVAADDRVVRRGVGRALVEHCLSEARSAGLREIECWSTLNGEGFYAALGFRSEGPMEVELAPGISFPSVRMRRAI